MAKKTVEAPQVRAANESDVEVLSEMALDLQQHVEASNTEIWRISNVGKRRVGAEIGEALRDPNSCVLMGLGSKNDPVGFAIGRVLVNDKYRPSMVGLVERVFVKRGWRRGGIGTTLLVVLSRFFQQKGVKDISLRYVHGNKEAEGFWRHLGFKPRIVVAGVSINDLLANLEGKR